LVDSLPSADEILRGSLLQRTIRHKKGCAKCAKGGGHQVWVLTVGYPGGVTKTVQPPPGDETAGRTLAEELPEVESPAGSDLRA